MHFWLRLPRRASWGGLCEISASADALLLSAPLCLQSAKQVAGGQDQKADKEDRESGVERQ
jgi:hypothetical protein